MSTQINVPSSVPGTDLELNMTEIMYAEGRIDEIAIVNTHKAPELMSCFIKAYAWCVEHVTNLTAEAVKAETAANFRKAEIILEEVPRILAEKGITGKSNADYRDAVIAMDKKHIELKERLGHIEMYREMFRGKLKSIELAYMAVRKVFGSGMDFRNPNLGSNHSPSSFGESDGLPKNHAIYIPEPSPYATTPNTTSSPTIIVTSSARSGFGKSKD